MVFFLVIKEVDIEVGQFIEVLRKAAIVVVCIYCGDKISFEVICGGCLAC